MPRKEKAWITRTLTSGSCRRMAPARPATLPAPMIFRRSAWTINDLGEPETHAAHLVKRRQPDLYFTASQPWQRIAQVDFSDGRKTCRT